VQLIFSPYASADSTYTLTTANYEFVDVLALFPGETRNLLWYRIITISITQFQYILVDDVSLISGGVEKIINGGFETGDFTGWILYPLASSFTIRTASPAPYHGTYYLRVGESLTYVWQPVSIPVNTVDNLSVWFFATGATADPCTNRPTSIFVSLNLAIYGPLSYTRTAQIGEDNWVEVDIKAVMVAAGVSNLDTINEIYLGNGSSGPPYYVDIDYLTPIGVWYEITLTEYPLSENTKYAIVCRATAGDDSNRVYWRREGDGYGGGCYEASDNSGVDWGSNLLYDFMFEVWGNIPPTPHMNTPHLNSPHENQPHLNNPHDNGAHMNTPHLNTIHINVPHGDIP
jgi:hypothetical protein